MFKKFDQICIKMFLLLFPDDDIMDYFQYQFSLAAFSRTNKSSAIMSAHVKENTAVSILCFYLGSTKSGTTYPNQTCKAPSILKLLSNSWTMFYHNDTSPPSFCPEMFFFFSLGKVGLHLSLVMFPPQLHVVGNCFLFFTLSFLQYKYTFRVMINVF